MANGETQDPRPGEVQAAIDAGVIEDPDMVAQAPEIGADAIPETGETQAAGETMDTPPNLDANLDRQANEALNAAESVSAVEIERAANEKIQETAFGRELLLGAEGRPGKLDALRDKVDSRRPRGAWEKFTYFIGTDKRADGYKEDRRTLKKAERTFGEWQRAEVEQCRQGDQMSQLQGLKLQELSNAESLKSQIQQFEDEAQALNAQIVGEGDGQEDLLEQVQALAAQKLEAIDSLRRSERMAKHYEKKELKLALGGHKDRAVLEEKVLPELAQLTGVTAELPIEKGSGRLFDSQEAIDDYVEKDQILSTLNKILTEPNSEEAKHLLKVLQAKMEGAEDAPGDPQVHRIAELLAIQPSIAGLDARHQEEFLKKEVGKSIRIAAEALKTRLLVEQRGNEKIDGMGQNLKTYNPRAVFDIIDKRILAEKHEKASQIGIKKARKGYVIKQGWDNLVRENIKKGARAAFSSDVEVQYDTRLRDILKDGSNMMAVVTQATGFLPAVLNPARLGALTKGNETIESMISWPISKIFKRSVAIRKWRTSLSERRNNTSLRITDGVDALTRVINDMDAIARRRNRRLGPRPSMRERAASAVNNVRNRVSRGGANNPGAANG